jgi:phospholipid/cholesterol/gamma-HCH transport system permease protein
MRTGRGSALAILRGKVDNSSTSAFLTAATQSGVEKMTATGEWSARHASAIDGAIRSLLSLPPRSASASIDMKGVRAFDTYGAWYLDRLLRSAESRGQNVSITGLTDDQARLFEKVRRANLNASKESIQDRPVFAGLAAIGKAMVEAWHGFVLLLNMLGAVCEASSRVVRRPSTFRFTSTVHQLDRVGWQAVPIILLITFLIGSIIAQQGFFHFRKFGADDYVVDMVGILVLREIGVLIVAIMVAGRSGSSYTAELGSMKMREEIDALRTMGFDPVEILILPRVIALVVALPILTFLGSMSALYGGELVAWLYGGMSPDIFVTRLREAISITHFKVGMIKAPFMALVIGIVACTEGLKVAGSAESLGLQTTASVVTSIFLVIVLDGLFAIFFASIGM